MGLPGRVRTGCRSQSDVLVSALLHFTSYDTEVLINFGICSFCPLPEISENALAAELGDGKPQGPFWKQYRCILGFVAQTCYVYVAPSLRSVPVRSS